MNTPEPALPGSPLPAGATGAVPAPEEAPNSLISTFTGWLAGLRFFTFSALFHIILLAMIGGTAMYTSKEEIPDFAPSDGLVSTDVTNLPPPPVAEPTLTSSTTPSTSATANASSPSAALTAMVTNAPSASFQLNATSSPVVRTDALSRSDLPPPSAMTGPLTKLTATNIAKFTGDWAKKKGGAGMPLKSREFEFTAYLAKYAGGDWSSTVRMDAGVIGAGSLPNLLFVMSRLSRDKVSGSPQAKPLDLASEEIFEKKPPFIFFTGHRDFVLTDKEIQNLRNYIMVGGCLWGDSSLPGQRSRFDIAFRREMRRVVPDLNKDWKQLPATHPIYTKSYFPDITEPPPGINHYHEPIYAIPGMADQIGVLYTPNDYGDMWQFGVDEHGEIDLSRDEQHRMVAVNEQMWWRRNVYFRNIEGKALLKTYKFGMNIAIHLMTRWEDKLGMAAAMQ